MEECWILIGMMGAGKSAVGRELAALTGREFVDTDQLLQGRFGRSIRAFFSVYGEDAFRGHETSVIASLSVGPKVISTGGGAVLREENWTEFRRLGRVIYLEASPETLIDRLTRSAKKRPLLSTENWEDKLQEILSARTPLYERADVRLSVDNMNVKEIGAAILAKLS